MLDLYTLQLTNDSILHKSGRICGTKMEVHDLVTGQVESSTLSRKFSQGTVFCMVEITKILCVGGNDPYTEEVYWCENNRLLAAAEMQIKIGWRGVIRIGNWVYAFG